MVDLETEVVLAVEVYHGNQSDADTLEDSVNTAAGHLLEAGSQAVIEEAVADKGFHKNQTLATCREQGLRTYVCEPDGPRRRWTDKPDGYEEAYRANRRRLAGERNKRLQKLRCERTERSFAHVCETGGGRRTWLRGLENNRKQADLRVAAHNLGLILRKLLGSGKPREFAGLFGLVLTLFGALQAVCRRLKPLPGHHRSPRPSNPDGEASTNAPALIPALGP